MKSKIHHTQSIRKNSVHKLSICHVQILEKHCCYIVIKIYQSTVSIIQLHNFAKLRKWKNKYTIQFSKVESPLLKNYFCKSPHVDSPENKKTPTPRKKVFQNTFPYIKSLLQFKILASILAAPKQFLSVSICFLIFAICITDKNR